MLFNPRYGTVGMFAIPCFVLFEVIGPFVEILGYVGLLLAFALGILELKLFLLFCTVSVLFGVFLSISAILLEELSYRRYPSWLDLVKLMIYGVLENLGYRQLLSIYKIRGFFGLLLSRRGWGPVERSGFGEYRVGVGRARRVR